MLTNQPFQKVTGPKKKNIKKKNVFEKTVTLLSKNDIHCVVMGLRHLRVSNKQQPRKDQKRGKKATFLYFPHESTERCTKAEKKVMNIEI